MKKRLITIAVLLSVFVLLTRVVSVRGRCISREDAWQASLHVQAAHFRLDMLASMKGDVIELACRQAGTYVIWRGPAFDWERGSGRDRAKTGLLAFRAGYGGGWR